MMDIPGGDNTDQLELLIRIKMEQMQRDLVAAQQQIINFTDKTGKEFQVLSGRVDQLDQRGAQMGRSWSSQMGAIRGATENMTTASAASFGVLASSIALTTKTFADYQSQVNTLQAISGATTKDLAAMEQKALDLGSATKFSASQMVEAEIELAKLGFTSREVVDAIDGIVMAAGAAGVPLAQASELVAGTVRGFNMDAKEAARVADIFAKAANVSALGFSDLQLSMKYVAPVAAAANQNLEDMVGVMAILSNNMIKGEQAGTSLRSVMSSLQNPSNEAAGIMKKLGLEVADAEGKIKPFPQLIAELQTKMQGLTQKTQNRLLGELFGTEAMSAASVLMKTVPADLDAMITQIERATGSSKEMSDIMNKGINHELNLMKSALEGVAIEFGKEFAPAVETAIKAVREFIELVGKIPDPVKDSIVQVTILGTVLAGVSSGAGLAVLGGLKMIDMLGKLKLAAQSTAPWLAPLLGPAGLAALGIGGVIGLGANLAINDATNSMNRESDAIDKKNTQTGENNSAMGRLSSIERIAGKDFKDLSKLTSEQLKAASEDAKKLIEMTKEQLKYETELSDLKKELQGVQGGLSAFDNDSEAQKRVSDLKGRIANLEKDVDARKSEIKKANQLFSQYSALQKKFDEELKKRATPKAGTDKSKEALFADGDGTKGPSKADEAIKRATAAYDAQMVAAEQLIAKNARASTGLSGMNDKLEEYSRKMVIYANSGKVCYQQFAKALKEAEIAAGVLSASGKELQKGKSLYADIRGGIKGSAGEEWSQAWRFKRVAERAVQRGVMEKYTPKAIGDVTPGTVAVFDAGTTSASGHIETVGRDGKGRSDFASDLIKQSLAMGKDGWAGQGKISFYRYKEDGPSKEQLAATAKQEALQTRINTLKAEQLKLDKSSQDFAKENQKFNEEIAKLQNDLTAAQTDGIKAQQEAEEERMRRLKELEEQRIQEERRQITSLLQLEGDVAQARAALTKDRLDDVMAAMTKGMADIKSQELQQVEWANISEAEKQKLREKFALARIKLTKDTSDQLRALDEEDAQRWQDLYNQAARDEIADMAEGLDKRLELLKQEETERIQYFERRIAEAEALGRADEAAFLREEIPRVQARFNRKRTQTIDDDLNSQTRSDIAKRQQMLQEDINLGQITPVEAFQAQQALYDEQIAQFEREKEQAKQRKDGATEIQNIEAKIAEIKAKARIDEKNFTEAQFRRQMEILELQQQTVSMFTGYFANSIQQMSQLSSQSRNMLTSVVSMASKGQSAMSSIAKMNVDFEKKQSLLKSDPKGPMGAMAKKSAQDGGLLGLDGTGGLISLALEAKGIIDQVGKGIMDSFFVAPEAMAGAVVEAYRLKNDLAAMDNDLTRQRIQNRRAQGASSVELYQEERALIESEGRQRLDRMLLDLEAFKLQNRTGLFGSTAEERERIKREEERYQQAVLVEQERQQSALFDLYQRRIEEEERLHKESQQRRQRIELDLAESAAALTPGMADDFEAQRQAAYDSAWNQAQAALADLDKAGVGMYDPQRANVWDTYFNRLDNADRGFDESGRGEEARLRGLESEGERARIEREQRGYEREASLIRLRTQTEVAAIDDRLAAQNLDLRERAALTQQRKDLLDQEAQDLVAAKQREVDAMAMGRVDLAAERAKATDTRIDDAQAEFERTMEQLRQEERKAWQDLSGPALDQALATIGQKRINAERTLQKTLAEIRATETKDLLNQQKTLIQEGLDLEKRQWEDLIRIEEAKLTGMQRRLEQEQRRLDDIRRQKRDELEAFNPEDAKQSSAFNADMAAFDPNALAWSGVGKISNEVRRDGLQNVSKETARLGLLEEAKILEMQAKNRVRAEKITVEQYAEEMKEVALIRAKAAEMELQTEGLTIQRQLELEAEWSDAYVAYQDAARQAIEARYLSQEQAIEKNMETQQREIQAVQDTVQGYQDKITALQTEADKKFRLIDDALLSVEKSTRTWSKAWDDVAGSINKALNAFNRAKEAGMNATLNQPSWVGQAVSTPTGASDKQSSTHFLQANDGKWYSSTTDWQNANKGRGLAKGGIVPPGYNGDKYGPVWLDSLEPVIPLDRFHDVLKPWLPPMPTGNAGPARATKIEVNFTGNHIASDVDMYEMAYRGARAAIAEQNASNAREGGRWL